MDNNQRIKRNKDLRKLRGENDIAISFMASDFDPTVEAQTKRSLRTLVKFLNELNAEDKITFQDELSELRRALNES